MTTKREPFGLLNVFTGVMAFLGAYYASSDQIQLAETGYRIPATQSLFLFAQYEMVALVVAGMLVFFRKPLGAMLTLLGTLFIINGISLFIRFTGQFATNLEPLEEIYFSTTYPVQLIGLVVVLTATVLSIVGYVKSKKAETAPKYVANADATTPAIAVLALVFSILFNLVGLILSIIAWNKIIKSGGKFKGLGLATSGLIISSIFLGLAIAAAITTILQTAAVL